MEIKEGYNGKPVVIRIAARTEGAEVWLNQPGLPDGAERYRETLSFASLQEIIGLRDECNAAIKQITGI